MHKVGTQQTTFTECVYKRMKNNKPRICKRETTKGNLNFQLSVSKLLLGASLAVQWLRIRLPMQGTQVWALVQEDPTCHGATKPVCHNYWAHVPQLLSPRAKTTEAHAPRAHASQWEATAMRSPCTTGKSSPRVPQLEKACTQQWRPNAAKNK